VDNALMRKIPSRIANWLMAGQRMILTLEPPLGVAVRF
jgi:hypothetical protein